MKIPPPVDCILRLALKQKKVVLTDLGQWSIDNGGCLDLDRITLWDAVICGYANLTPNGKRLVDAERVALEKWAEGHKRRSKRK